MILCIVNYVGAEATTCIVADEVTKLQMEISFSMAVDLAKQIGFSNAVIVRDEFFRAKPGKSFIKRRIKNGKIISTSKSEIVERRESNTTRCEQGKRNINEEYRGWQSQSSGKGVMDVSRKADGEYHLKFSGNCSAICDVITAKFVNAELFRRYFIHERQRVSKGAFVDVRNLSDLRNCKCIMVENGKGFIAVSEDGNINSLMRSPSYTGRNFATNMLAHAINNGGEKLDCYAMYGFGLAHLYSVRGFVPVCKVRFDDKYKQEDWKDEWGKPDIVFFFYCGDSVQDFIKNTTECKYPYYEEYDYVPYVTEFPEWYRQSGCNSDYEFGAYIRDIVLEFWKTKYKCSFRDKLTLFVKRVIGKNK